MVHNAPSLESPSYTLREAVMRKALTAVEWLLALVVPLALIGLGVRILLTPLYLTFEYSLPGFPPDEYGFSAQERLHWGSYGLNYVLSGAPPSYLGDLRFDDGSPLFTDREVGHMRDVQRIVSGLLRGWYAIVLLIVALAVWAWRAGWFARYRRGLRRGGWLTLGIAGIAAVIGTLGTMGSGDVFWQFFSAFHELFFSGDSWLFAYSDTLIRLYPLRFWQDSVLYIGVLAALGAAGLAFGLREPPRKSSDPP